MKNWVFYVLLFLGMSALIHYLSKDTIYKDAKMEGDDYVLHVHWFFAVMSMLGLVLGLVFGFFITTSDELSGAAYLYIPALVFFVTGIVLFMYYKNHKVRFNANSISVDNLLGTSKKMSWQAIHSAKYNLMSGWVELKSKEERIKLHVFLVGMATFMIFLDKHTKWNAKKIGFPYDIESAE